MIQCSVQPSHKYFKIGELGLPAYDMIARWYEQPSLILRPGLQMLFLTWGKVSWCCRRAAFGWDQDSIKISDCMSWVLTIRWSCFGRAGFAWVPHFRYAERLQHKNAVVLAFESYLNPAYVESIDKSNTRWSTLSQRSFYETSGVLQRENECCKLLKYLTHGN